LAPAATDKPKPVDNKPKPAKPLGAKDRGKGRSDKRAAMAATAEAKLRQRSAGRRKGPQRAQQPPTRLEPLEKKPIVLGESITVQELAQKLHRGAAELIKKLMHLGVMATINQEIDTDTAGILAGEFGYEIEIKLPVDLEALLMQEPEEDPALVEWRPCVVTVMGHVDHGKTSLLDSIRETNVIATEAGGITQHIGAYQVEHKGKKITFVDTPGHEAFTAMRARGANVTDIVVLVVAADDGVMPQTVEAINHAKAAKVPIIVAINKMDKPGANPDRVKQELTEHGLVAEQWGGETICVEVSALKKQGISELLEMVLLVAELGEIKANPNRPARGTVIEAELDKGRGPVATVLVQNGTLNVGDTIIAGAVLCRVRAMVDDKGRRIKKAGPSTPVEVLGFSEMPAAGDPFVAVTDEKLARTIAGRRQIKKREEELRGTTRVSLDDLFKRIQEGQIKELGIIIKADVQGSVEALRQSLERLNTGEVKVNIIHGGVGAITETDIMLASTSSNVIVIGFNVRPDINARKAIEVEKVDTRLYRVIYDAIEDVKKAMSGLLEPEYREVMLGRVEIRKIFKASKIGTIAGCYVLEGKIERDAQVRVVRDGIVVHEGKLDSLKRFKDDVKEVATGYECGIALEKYNEIEEGDIIEAFTMETIKRELA
jgi:translation initiation factor IF-2